MGTHRKRKPSKNLQKNCLWQAWKKHSKAYKPPTYEQNLPRPKRVAKLLHSIARSDTLNRHFPVLCNQAEKYNELHSTQKKSDTPYMPYTTRVPNHKRHNTSKQTTNPRSQSRNRLTKSSPDFTKANPPTSGY